MTHPLALRHRSGRFADGFYTDYEDMILWNGLIFDRIINGDVISDNAYAGGDNFANITLDNFTFNSLNSNLNRDWTISME